MNDRLYRSRDDRVFAGVCGGIADYFDVDPSLVRILYALVTILTGIFPLLLLYIVIAIIVPEEPLPGTIPPGPGWGPAGAWGAGGPSWGQPWGAPGAPGSGAPGAPGSGGTPGGSDASAAGAAGAQGGVDGSGAGDTGTGMPPGPGTPPGWPGYTDWRSQRAAWRAQRREMRAAWRAERHAYGPNTGAIVVGVLLVVFGAWFFLQQAVPSLNAGWFWPVILIVVGAMFLAGSLRSGGPGQH